MKGGGGLSELGGLSSRSCGLWLKGTALVASLINGVLYPLDLKWVVSVLVFCVYVMGSVLARSMRVSSPFTIPLCMALGCAELWWRYWNVFVGLKCGRISRWPVVLNLCPL